MAKRTPYENLVLLPYVVAETVATQVYDGSELGIQLRSESQTNRIEALRQKMTRPMIEEFCQLVDVRCKAAYEAKADWFLKCLRNGKENRGRAQLYVWVQHWLASYLNNPEMLRRSAQ
jgi:hypothetical protein